MPISFPLKIFHFELLTTSGLGQNLLSKNGDIKASSVGWYAEGEIKTDKRGRGQKLPILRRTAPKPIIKID